MFRDDGRFSHELIDMYRLDKLGMASINIVKAVLCGLCYRYECFICKVGCLFI